MPKHLFKSGEKRPATAGRVAGTPNKATVEVRQAARNIVENPAYLVSLEERLLNGTAPHMEPLMWHYAYGKPKDILELTPGIDAELTIHIQGWGE